MFVLGRLNVLIYDFCDKDAVETKPVPEQFQYQKEMWCYETDKF